MPNIQCACGRVLTYRPELAGKTAKCPACSARIRLPADAPPDEAPDLQLEKNDVYIPAELSATERAPLPPVEPMTWPQDRSTTPATPDPAESQDYWSVLPGAFGFPLKGDGFIAWIVGVIVMTIGYVLVGVLSGFPSAGMINIGGVVALVFSVVAAGYFAGYAMTLVERTAHGAKDAPNWPDLSDWEDNAVKPFGYLLALAILCVGPSLAYRYLAHDPNPAIRYAILAAGLFYLPMGFLCVSLANDPAGLSPIRVIRAIVSVPGRYVVVWALVAGAVGVWLIATGLIRSVAVQVAMPQVFNGLMIPLLIILAASILQNAVACYLLFVAARSLGLLCYKSGRQLNWLVG